ncbi:hypothetical protein TYRP_003080 [Tyrophagus putrescentiae]|nr:hypothetical protein TYRP_003080 [Tyrophagus putrescentiae]
MTGCDNEDAEWGFNEQADKEGNNSNEVEKNSSTKLGANQQEFTWALRRFHTDVAQSVGVNAVAALRGHRTHSGAAGRESAAAGGQCAPSGPVRPRGSLRSFLRSINSRRPSTPFRSIRWAVRGKPTERMYSSTWAGVHWATTWGRERRRSATSLAVMPRQRRISASSPTNQMSKLVLTAITDRCRSTSSTVRLRALSSDGKGARFSGRRYGGSGGRCGGGGGGGGAAVSLSDDDDDDDDDDDGGGGGGGSRCWEVEAVLVEGISSAAVDEVEGAAAAMFGCCLCPVLESERVVACSSSFKPKLANGRAEDE